MTQGLKEPKIEVPKPNREKAGLQSKQEATFPKQKKEGGLFIQRN
jgi:hypothetical protein